MQASTILLLAYSFHLSVQKFIESPYGLTFTPTAIIASRFNSSGLIETLKHTVPTEYITFYEDVVAQYGSDVDYSRDMSDAAALFRKVIDPITQSLTKQIGKVPEYRSLFMPSVFQYMNWNAAGDIAFLKGSLEQPTKVGPSQMATCYAYKFLECRHLDRTTKECNDDGPPNLIFVLEYENDYLYAWLKEVAFEIGTFPVSHQKICKECGARFRNVSIILVSAKTSGC